MKLVFSLVILSLVLSMSVGKVSKALNKAEKSTQPDESVIDKYPKQYKIFNQGYQHPSTQKVYGLDPKPYYGDEERNVQPHEIDSQTGPLHFYNPKLLKKTSYDKFQNVPSPESTYVPAGPINKKDPSPYYDPI